ncbi:MAG: ParB/RepB/Spo0J family partition protein [Clostridia bacterium]|nr:ParB/RepB/Spo0J family partition protein [Clostridia bacterium]
MKDLKDKRREKEVLSIEVDKIARNPGQPRKVFADDAILKLADSIRQFGIIQPLIIRETAEGYELISGERRLRAAKELGMERVPCIINEASNEASAEMAIIENLIREDLNIFEEAEAIETLLDTYSLTQEEIASRLSSSQSSIANKLRLLRLDKDEREKILKNKLTERHARALLRIFDKDARAKALETIISQGLNVARSEEYIENLLAKSKPSGAQKQTYKTVTSFYSAIERAIGVAENSGIKIKSRKIEGDEFTELTIMIRKEGTSEAEQPCDNAG